MATPVNMPDFGTNVESVTLRAWTKQVGEPVEMGEVLCEVETDKAVTELESHTSGVLLACCAAEGDEVSQGTVVAYVGQAGETVPDDADANAQAAPAAEPPRSVAAGGNGRESSPPPAQAAPPAGRASRASLGTYAADGIKASPMIRNIAQRDGLDLAGLCGSGPGGQILRTDLRAAQVVGGPGSPTVRPDDGSVPSAPGQAAELSRNQRAVWKRVARSHAEIVPIHFQGRVEISAAIALRERTAPRSGRKISFDAIFLHAVGVALSSQAGFRRGVEGDRVVAYDPPGVGVAIAVGEELYTPTVSDPGRRGIAEVDADVRRLADAARAGRLTPAEMAGACMTISNLGMLPVRSFVAVVAPGQSAALAIGRTTETLLIEQGRLRTAPVAEVTLTVDHRIINGRQAGEFLRALIETMESL
jgi:pyruvate dehydrogenase E2 component (dihydrolipoamide acetyltransferase)